MKFITTILFSALIFANLQAFARSKGPLDASSEVVLSPFGPTTLSILILGTELGLTEPPDKEIILAAKEDAAIFLVDQNEKSALLADAMNIVRRHEKLSLLSDQEIAQALLTLEAE